MENSSCDIDSLYEKYASRLYHTSLRIVGDSMDAEEVMHDTLMKFVRIEEPPPTLPQQEAWLVKVCVRASIDVLRRKKKRMIPLSEFGDTRKATVPDPEAGWADFLNDAAVATTDKIGRIRAGIEKLSGKSRLVLSLLLFEGYDYDEIAGITGLKVSSVRAQYVRAKAKLLEKLQHHG